MNRTTVLDCPTLTAIVYGIMYVGAYTAAKTMCDRMRGLLVHTEQSCTLGKKEAKTGKLTSY